MVVRERKEKERKDKRPHLVYVEDDAFLAAIYTTKFEHAGFRITIAKDGEAGLLAVKKKKPDVILLDILLPKRDGFSLLSELKAHGETRDIPVVILTSLGQKGDVEKGLALGAADYLVKSHTTPVETVERVRKALGG